METGLKGWREVGFHMNDGFIHPPVGFGSYKIGFIPGSASGQNGIPSITDDDVPAIMKAVVQSGTRCVDCAAYYANEKYIGDALVESGLDRKEWFIVSKVWTSQVYDGEAAIRESLEKTLADLRTDYLDLYLIHWPVPGKHVEAFRTLQKLQQEGKIRSIGVSNYSVEDVEEIIAACGVAPAVAQLEVNPFLFREKTIFFMKSKGIVIESYRGMHNGKSLRHPILLEMAAKYNCTVPQLMGKFLLQNGIVFIAKSSKPERILDNVKLDHFTISQEDIQILKGLTTEEALDQNEAVYHKHIVRDTPLETTYSEKKKFTRD